MSMHRVIERLAWRRRRKGIEINEIADATRIQPRYLEAIEERRFDQLPEGIYRRSYLRQYANAIDQRLTRFLEFAMLTEEEAKSIPGADTWVWRNPVVRCIGAAVAFFLPLEATPTIKKPAPATCPSDPRCGALAKFFQKYKSPLARLTSVFLTAADRHGLDWRLLPSIAITETGGKPLDENQNVFGWNNGKTKFASLAASIHHVASRLASAPAYAGKTTYSKLRTYNPGRPHYPDKVMAVMSQISVPAVATAGDSGE